jgi:phage-related protein
VFIKKTQQTPRPEIALALRRIAEVERDENHSL